MWRSSPLSEAHRHCMHKPAGLIPAGIVDMNTDILVSQCTTRNTNNLMHTQAGSCTNVKQRHEDGDIVLMLRFSLLVFFHLLPFLLRMMHAHLIAMFQATALLAIYLPGFFCSNTHRYPRSGPRASTSQNVEMEQRRTGLPESR